MVVGAPWAGIAGVLKVTRGVSEVISTIMLNAIAVALVAYLLRTGRRRVRAATSSAPTPIPESSLARRASCCSRSAHDRSTPGRPRVAGRRRLLRSCSAGPRFGFDLRATGMSESAAVASGVNVKRMVVIAMLLSGAVAGLVGMPSLFGDAYTYGTTFQAGLGFTGIAVALLGRNHPVGIAFGALLFAFLNEQSNPLHPGRHLAGHRRDHPGRHRARRGHRLRGRPPLPVAAEQRARTKAARAEQRASRRSRHEHR